MTWHPEHHDGLTDFDRELEFEAHNHPGRRVYVPPRPRQTILRRTWMGLKPDPDNALYWTGIAEMIFRPQGIVSVAAPLGALLHEFSVGNQRLFPMSSAVPIEAFTELDRVLGDSSPARPSFPPMPVGMKLCIHVTAPDGVSPLVWPSHFTVWGVVPESF